MSDALAPSDPLIPALVSVLIVAALSPSAPLIADLTSESLITLIGAAPKAPCQLALIAASERVLKY